MDAPQVLAPGQQQLPLHRGTRGDLTDHCMVVADDKRHQYQTSGLLPSHIAINEVLQFAFQ